jgi:hypothetical protein
MRSAAFTLVVFCWWLPLAAAEDKPAELSIEATGLRVVAPFKNADVALNAFGNRASGTCVSLLIASPANFIHFDASESIVTKFADDKGKDLLAKVPGPAPAIELLTPQGFGAHVISKEGNACAIEVNSPLLPEKGSTTLKLAGTITMICASGKKELIQKDVRVKDGSKLEADGLKMTFYAVGKPQFDKDPLSITLTSHDELDRVADIKFFKPDGTEIKSRSTMKKSAIAGGGSLTVDWAFNLAELTDVVTVKIYLWSDIQKKKQDFELAISTGL